jgi:hypothetical protein
MKEPYSAPLNLPYLLISGVLGIRERVGTGKLIVLKSIIQPVYNFDAGGYELTILTSYLCFFDATTENLILVIAIS